MEQKLETKINQLMTGLEDRERDIICGRFGLKCSKKSLQALGDDYKLTRERIRQIESDTLKKLCKPDRLKKVNPIIAKIYRFIENHGGVVSEEYLVDKLAGGDKMEYAYIKFILALSNNCNLGRFDSHLNDHWYTNEKAKDVIRKALQNIEKKLSLERLINKDEIIEMIDMEVGKSIKGKTLLTDKSNFVNIMTISKKLGSNFLNEYGSLKSEEINLRNTRSYIKLILRRNKKPMHFREIAKAVGEIKGIKVNPHTCHNELIYYDDFVKVGNGIYAIASDLKYKGNLIDAIKEIIKSSKGKKATRQEIIDKIKEERIIKEPTIAKYLYDKKTFTRNTDGTYSLA